MSLCSAPTYNPLLVASREAQATAIHGRGVPARPLAPRVFSSLEPTEERVLGIAVRRSQLRRQTGVLSKQTSFIHQ